LFDGFEFIFTVEQGGEKAWLDRHRPWTRRIFWPVWGLVDIDHASVYIPNLDYVIVVPEYQYTVCHITVNGYVLHKTFLLEPTSVDD
jgi:hypothetical protein